MFFSRHTRWVGVAAVAATLALTAGPAFAAAGWAVVSIPLTGTNTQLNGVFARTNADAWAVGEQYSSPIGPVAYRWNGSAWSLVSTPALTSNSSVTAVAADSETDAWAVGFSQTAG